MQCIPHILFLIDFSVVLVVNGIYFDIDFFNQISGLILDKMELFNSHSDIHTGPV